eukprot:1032919-Rhodomonas_salina.2
MGLGWGKTHEELRQTWASRGKSVVVLQYILGIGIHRVSTGQRMLWYQAMNHVSTIHMHRNIDGYQRNTHRSVPDIA